MFLERVARSSCANEGLAAYQPRVPQILGGRRATKSQPCTTVREPNSLKLQALRRSGDRRANKPAGTPPLARRYFFEKIAKLLSTKPSDVVHTDFWRPLRPGFRSKRYCRKFSQRYTSLAVRRAFVSTLRPGHPSKTQRRKLIAKVW